MSFNWLKMRISEEQDRRRRDAQIRDRLPRATDDLRNALSSCVQSYTNAFGAEAAELQSGPGDISVIVREERGGEWQTRAKVEIAIVESVPGFQIHYDGQSHVIEVGLLPGDKLFYRDREKDQYVSMDEVTHLALDRAFFPKLKE